MVVIDIETTGVDPRMASIVSIGAVDFNDPSRTFYEECRIWEGAHILEEALAVNGMTREEITNPNKKTEAEITKKFLGWALKAKNHTIAGQNPFFDYEFIQAACFRAKMAFPLARRIVDLHSIVYFTMMRSGAEIPIKNGRTSIDSDFIMEYVGIPAEPKPHKAINGAKWEAEALSRLIFKRSLFPEFQKYAIPEALKSL